MSRSLASIIPQFGHELSIVLFLIFGGCCTNVYTLEAIVLHNNATNPALALTFIQFVFVAVEGFAHFFNISSKTLLRQPELPRWKWFGIAILHFTISVLNNLSLEYHISVPMHIVLRSGGGLVTLAVGALAGKLYSKTQWISVATMTLGVVLAALGGPTTSDNGTPASRIGVLLLLFIQVLTAMNSLMLEHIYKNSPRIWREGLFYTHLLALPLFLPFMPKIITQLSHLATQTQLEMSMPRFSNHVVDLPTQSLLLTLNALTQFLCVRGVSLLTSISSALSVCMVLNVRKLVSLLLSVWIFGAEVRVGFVLGTVVVFGSVAFYARDDWKRSSRGGGMRNVNANTPYEVGEDDIELQP